MNRKRSHYARTLLSRVVLAAAVLLPLGGSALAVPSGSNTAEEALILCRRADAMTGEQREEMLARGMELAERAAEVNQRDGLAHFAIVCNLGRKMQASGMGLAQLFRLRRLKRELDTTLELAPNDPDSLVAKGALLLQLPRLLGGDVVEAEKLLRHALDVEPDNGAARCYLAQALSARGVAPEHGMAAPHC